MKAFAYFALPVLAGLIGCASPSQSTSRPLAPLADRALAEGEDGKLNVWFAQFLGLEAHQPLRLKRLQFENDGAINRLHVLLEDHNAIILSERRQLIGTFYLTDRSGNLRRAVVNDGAITDGGITNLTLESAAAGFEKQKQLWLRQQGH